MEGTPCKDLGLAKGEEQFCQRCLAKPMFFTCCYAPEGASISIKFGWTGGCCRAGMAVGGKPSAHTPQRGHRVWCVPTSAERWQWGTGSCTVPSQSLPPPHRWRQKSGPED